MTSFFTKLNALCQQVSSSATTRSSGPNRSHNSNNNHKRTKQQQHGLTDKQWEQCKRTGWSHFFESLLDGQQSGSGTGSSTGSSSKDDMLQMADQHQHQHHHYQHEQSPFLALAVFAYRLRAIYSRQDEANALDQLCRELQQSMRQRTILLSDALQESQPAEPACVTEKLHRSTLKQQRSSFSSFSYSSSSSSFYCSTAERQQVQQWQEPEAILRLLLSLASLPPAKKYIHFHGIYNTFTSWIDCSFP